MSTPVTPNEAFGPTISPIGGSSKAAAVGNIPILLESTTIKQNNTFQFNRFALTPPSGPKQKTLHTRGTSELNFSISGDLSLESANILQFLSPAQRGKIFPIVVQQGSNTEYLSTCFMESFQLSGSPNGLIRFSLSGKSVSPLRSNPAVPNLVRHHPVPSWASGNLFVKTWSVTHSIQLSPNWFNTQSTLPAYYRPGESEYSLSISTAAVLKQYSNIALGLGVFGIISGTVNERGLNISGKDVKSYNITVSNVSLSPLPGVPIFNAITPGATITIGNPPDAWPDL